MKDVTLSKALMWIFIAQILVLVGGLLPIVAIVGYVLNLVALYAAGKLDEGYKTAFILTIVNTVLSVVASFAGDGLGSIVSIASSVVNLCTLYYVVMTTVKQLEAAGHSDVAAKGVTVWKLNLICTIVAVVLSVLLLIPVIQVIAAVLAIVVGIVSLVAGILYLIFLYKSSKVL